MPHNATESGSSGRGLNPKQLEVLTLLLAGHSVSNAARIAEVDRTTVHRWMRDQGRFQEAYEDGIRDLQATYRQRVILLLDNAITAVQALLLGGDARTPVAVLEKCGLLSPSLLGDAGEGTEEEEEDELGLEEGG